MTMRWITDTLQKTKRKLRRYYVENISKDEFLTNIYRWKDAEGDRTLRLDYPLDEKSVVFDLGGYAGDFSAQLFCKFNCYIYIFEPIPEYAERIKERFKCNEKIKVITAGLSDRTDETQITFDGTSSSIFRDDSAEKKTIKLIAIEKFLEENNIIHIDLIKVNIEGAEYDLFEHIINIESLNISRFYQIQFHDFIPQARYRREYIQDRLRKNHRLAWEFPFVWESWERKND